MHSIAMRNVNTIADIIINAFDRMHLEVIVQGSCRDCPLNPQGNQGRVDPPISFLLVGVVQLRFRNTDQ